MISQSLVVAFVTLCVAGCAGVDVVRVNPNAPNQEGVRFYRPRPYLWVTRDKEGNPQGTIVWLPDKSEEYAITVKSGFGSSDVKFKLADGWNLTEFGDTRDSKIPETITALTGSLKGIEGVFKLTETPELLPGLYVFLFDKETGIINDLKPVVQFK